MISRVHNRRVSISPEKAISGYSNTIGAIVRETVQSTCKELRAKDEADIISALLEKLLKQYCFKIYVDDDTMDREVMKRITHKALSMMSKALNTWRHTTNLKKNEDFDTYIKKRWPQIEWEQWKLFIASHSNEHFEKISKWGKDMQSQNKMNHKLGSHGYLGKRKVWAKEDKGACKAGRDKPFWYLENGHTKDFVRARATIDKQTWQPVFNSDEL
jgi:hypothetical protein